MCVYVCVWTCTTLITSIGTKCTTHERTEPSLHTGLGLQSLPRWTLIREVSSHGIWELTPRTMIGWCTEWETLPLSLKWGVFIKPPPPRSVWKALCGRGSESWWVSDVDNHKETVSSAHKTTDAQRDSETAAAHMACSGFMARCGPSREGKMDTVSHP